PGRAVPLAHHRVAQGPRRGRAGGSYSGRAARRRAWQAGRAGEASTSASRPGLGRAGRVGAVAPTEREARQGLGADPGRAGDHGKSARALGAALRERTGQARAGAEQVMNDVVAAVLDAGGGVRRGCTVVGRARLAHHQRTRTKPGPVERSPRAAPANALRGAERDRVLALLRDPSFVDKSPA